MIKIYSKVRFKDGKIGTVVGILGQDYVVDFGTSPEDWDTILTNQESLELISE